MFEDVPSKVRDFFNTAVSTRFLAVLAPSMGLWANRWGLLRYPDTGR